MSDNVESHTPSPQGLGSKGESFRSYLRNLKTRAASILGRDKTTHHQISPDQNPALILNMLQTNHSARFVDSLPPNQPKPRVYDYTGMTTEQVGKAIAAIKQQRTGEDPKTIRRIVADLSPAQIVLLNSNPWHKLYLPEETESTIRRWYENELDRLSQFPEIAEVVKFDPTTTQYIHTTDQYNAEQIRSGGLRCHRNGLSGVAENLTLTEIDNLSRVARRHKGLAMVVVVNLPPLPSAIKETTARANKDLAVDIRKDALFAQELPEDEKVTGSYIRNYDYFIPAKYIKGYFDTETGKFIKNPDFNPILEDREIQKMREILANLNHLSYLDFQ